jgi:deazaflavin-dependent oxidoreductase (nitroreductase family)
LPFVGSARVLLLTVVGRRSGRPRTTPLFYLRDGTRLVVCNVRPVGERSNPWVANVRAAGQVMVEIGGQRREVRTREADAEEVARYWPGFVRLWPTYDRHFRATGERTLFVLEPTEAS